jgi:hypothetical protein
MSVHPQATKSGEAVAQTGKRRTGRDSGDSLVSRFLDEAAIRLLGAMILFAPWALGSTPAWAVWVINGLGWMLGVVVLARRWVVWRERNSRGAGSEPPPRAVLGRVLAVLTVLFLLYVLVSAINYRADYLEYESRFNYREGFIPWLPHSYDVSQTWRVFGGFVALTAVFWGVRDYLCPGHGRGPQHRERPHGEARHGPHLSRRTIFLLSLLCLNIGAVALEGMIQRWSGTNKLLWILEPRINNTPEVQFGPYAYRANAAQLFNLGWPVCMGLCWGMVETGLARTRRVLWAFLLGAAMVTAAAPLMTTSRAGAGVTVVCLALMVGGVVVFHRGSRAAYWVLGLAVLALLGGGVAGSQRLRERIWAPVYVYPTEYTELKGPFAIKCRLTLPAQNPGLFMGVAGLTGKEDQLDRSPSALAVFVERDGRLEAQVYGGNGEPAKYVRVPGFLQRFAGQQVELTVMVDEGLRFAVDGQPLPATSVIDRSEQRVLPVRAGYLWVGRMYPGGGAYTAPIHAVEVAEAGAGFGGEAGGQGELRTTFRLQLGEMGWGERLRRQFSSRGEIVTNARAMAGDYPWFGSGAGTFVSLYQLYRGSVSQVRHAYLHNDWMEFRITLGRIGLGLLLALLGCSLILPGVRGRQVVPPLLLVSLYIALAGCLLHAVIDFPFQVHSVALTFVILCGITSSLAIASSTDSTSEAGLAGEADD